MEKKADYLFEISWEVCNKVGGIYTVVKSKAAPIMEYYKENYFLVGPYFPKKAFGEFQEELVPDNLRHVFETLRGEGIDCKYGKWLIGGEPNTLLVEFSNFVNKKNEIKKGLWDEFGIDSLNTGYFDFEEPVIWATAVGKLLEEIQKAFADKKIVAHFHEWLTGAGLLYLKKINCPIATIFTTHATMLGRTIAAHEELYGIMDKINPLDKAYVYNMQAKYMTEKQSALNADVFSTVSEITGIEAEKLLGKKPDVLLPNGLNLSKFPTFEDAAIKHRLFKSKIREFMLYYFFPYYSFDLEKTLMYFLAGRYEFHDKGIDVFIRALSKLNERLKEEKSEKTIVAFFWVPGNIKGIKPELLESKTFYRDIQDSLEEAKVEVIDKMLYGIISHKEITKATLFNEEFLSTIKKKVMKLQREGSPPLSTHDLYNEEKDLIISHFREYNLTNKEEDKVKVVFYPIYLTGADSLLDTSYYESMLGSHLGVFPSYYEPWGYTPLEGGALGIASITTDLSGFGRYLLKQGEQKKNPGIFVLNRFNKSDDEVVEELANTLYSYSQLTRKERIENKINARGLADLADWKFLVEHYIEAHNLAVSKRFGN